MTRESRVIECDLQSNSRENNESQTQAMSADPSDKRLSDVPGSIKQERGSLPNVTSLMKSRFHNEENIYESSLARVTNECQTQKDNTVVGSKPNTLEKNSQDVDNINNSAHGEDFDIKYFYSEHGHDKTDKSVSYLHQTHNVFNNKEFGNILSSESLPLASEPLRPELSQEKLEVSCIDQNSFLRHPHSSYSDHHRRESISPVFILSKKHLNASDNPNKIPYDYCCQNRISSWEQENDAYVDYTWRNHIYSDKTFVYGNPRADISVNASVKNSAASNINIGNSFNKACLSEMSGSNLVSNCRRRRRRVQTPVQRSAANMRERRRMCHLNVAFDRLKEHLPNIKNKQKLSRIQTLKAAIDYINLLRESLSI